jgi:putative transcriptional regulator
MDLSFQNKRKAKKGRVLLADPFSKDKYFGRSVVYLGEHNDEGSFGFVLNNFIDLDLQEIAKNFPKMDTRVSIGGPVKTENIYFIHTLGEVIPDSQLVDDGIYLGGDYDTLLQLIEQGKVAKNEVRFFLGYSGWSPGQLKEELDANAWVVAPVLSSMEVMDVKIDELWEHYMRRQGKKFELLSKFPADFSLN